MHITAAPHRDTVAPAHPARTATLVLMSGMPGTGRRELAARLARERGWALLNKDVVTRALAEVGIADKLAAYTVIFRLAALNLGNGMSTVLDGSFSLPRTRTQARTVAETAGAAFVAVSCVCSDPARWQQRLASDPPVEEGWASPAFASPNSVQKRYYPFRGPHLLLDTVESLDACYARLLAYLAAQQGDGAPMQDANRPAAIKVLHAGALTRLIREGLGPAFAGETGIAVESERGHSVALATAIRAGEQTGDLYMSADASVNATLTGARNGDLVRWYVTIARNAIVRAYSPISAHVADFERARQGIIPWYDVLTKPGVRLVRNDPNDDPGGYYALFVCQLAERHYGVPGLAGRILSAPGNREQVGQPDFGRLTRGEVDAFLVYRTGAIDSGLPFIELPDAINLSDPAHAESYAQAGYTTTTGLHLRGVPIRFSATVLTHAAHPGAAARFLSFVLSPAGQELVRAHHFLPSPAPVGGDADAMPSDVARFIQGRLD
jgi:molybdate/tungstate transport system substrate-binding protein